MAAQPQSLSSIPLIRRKGAGDEPAVPALAVEPAAKPALIPQPIDGPLTMKPRETVQLAAVHVRIPEQIARGLRLMSVLEGRQAQELAAAALEAMLDRWNPNWRSSVPPKS